MVYQHEFVERWGTYEKCFHKWDNDRHKLSHPNEFPLPNGGPFQVVLITHDESMFYQNNHCKIAWTQKNSRLMPQPKGEGQLIMISDFLTSEWGCLHNGNESVSIAVFPPFVLLTWTPLFREARIIFKAEKNHHGYFGTEEILTQVDSAINIFEGLSKGNFRALFMFDNAPSH
jgi:hypothetical protein